VPNSDVNVMMLQSGQCLMCCLKHLWHAANWGRQLACVSLKKFGFNDLLD
jgi:hypothetical protein